MDLSSNPDLFKKNAEVSAVCECLEEMPEVSEVDVSESGLRNSTAVDILRKLLSTDNRISTISLRNSRLDDRFAELFSEAYASLVPGRRSSDLSRLVHIDLRRNSIGPGGGKALGSAFGACGSAIEVLLLGWNSLKSEGARAILSGLAAVKPVSRITRLDLSYNSLSDDLAPDLANFMTGARCLTLVELDLSHNNLQTESAAVMRSILTERNRMHTFSIGFNPLGTPGTAMLIECSRKNAIRTLHIENTTVGGSNAESAFNRAKDVQYCWELAQRVVRSKSVLLMMRSRKRYDVKIHVEYPPQERTLRNRLFKSVAGWLEGRGQGGDDDDDGDEGAGGKNGAGGKDGNSASGDNTNSDSVFHPRIAECESSSFWDSAHVIGAAFEEDWIKLNWHKIKCGKRGIKMSPAEENRVHRSLKSNYNLIKELFCFYSATQSGRAKGNFCMTMHATQAFVSDMKLWPESYPKAQLDLLFVQAATERLKRDEALEKQKRAQYLHANMDDGISLASDTGHINQSSLMKIVGTHHQIKEVHSVREKLKKKKKLKKLKKMKTSGKVQFHSEDGQARDKNGARALTPEERGRAHQKALMQKKNKKKAMATSFGGQKLRRSEFLGFIFRVAVCRFMEHGGMASVEDALAAAIDGHIIPNAFGGVEDLVDKSFLFDRNMFRDEKLYFQEVDQVFRERFVELQAIYARYATCDTVGDSDNYAYKGRFRTGDVMKIEDFVKVIASLDDKALRKSCTRRCINIAFVFSQMLSSADGEDGSQATFVEFLEALARLADMCVGKEVKGLRVPMSLQLTTLLDSLCRGNEKIIKKFQSRMGKVSRKVAAAVSSSRVSWTKEARSSTLDGTMRWLERSKERSKAGDGDAATDAGDGGGT